MGWKARVNKISILLQDAFFLSGAKATVSKCNVLTIGIVLRRSAGVLLGRIHCQSGSDCCRRFRFGCLGPARSPRSLKRFIPNRSSGLGEIARLCHAACFPSAEGVAGNRMRTEAGKMPESLIFPIRNGLGVSNDRFGFIPYLRSLHVPVLAFLTGDALAGIPVWGRAFGAFPENNRARQGRIPWRFRAAAGAKETCRTASPDAESGGTRGFMLSCRDILGGRLFRDVPRQGWDKGGLSRLRVCSCAGWRCFRVPENRAGETGLGGIARRSEFGE